MGKIKRISAREILDSRGNPTLEVEIEGEKGISAQAAVPSGASTGSLEAVELRDGDMSRYGGLGVLKAARNVKEKIAKAVCGMDVSEQRKIDEAMIDLDGTPDKSNLGANAILGVSLAACRLAAAENNLPLYYYLNSLSKPSAKISREKFPVPMFNVLNGGKHSDSGLSFQEFMVIPKGVEGFSDRLRAGSEIFHCLKKVLEKRGYSTGVGDEGGYSPKLESQRVALDFITQAAEEAGYRPGARFFIGLDVAANSFYNQRENQYLLKPEGVHLSREGLINTYRELAEKYQILIVEDGLQEEDWEGWRKMTEKLNKILIVGDDLTVTNAERLKKAAEEKACNALIIKPNQIGTLMETLECVKLAKDKRIKIIVSHRSGETADDFIADLAVGIGADFIKSGSLSRGERIGKYNRLMKIEEELETR